MPCKSLTSAIEEIGTCRTCWYPCLQVHALIKAVTQALVKPTTEQLLDDDCVFPTMRCPACNTWDNFDDEVIDRLWNILHQL